MKTLIKILFFTSLLSVFYGCVSVSFLPTDEVLKYTPSDSIKVYWVEPQESYSVLGKIIVESDDYSEEKLYKILKKKAIDIGANAIIMAGSSQQNSVYGTPMNGGTLILSGTKKRIEAFAIRFKI